MRIVITCFENFGLLSNFMQVDDDVGITCDGLLYLLCFVSSINLILLTTLASLEGVMVSARISNR